MQEVALVHFETKIVSAHRTPERLYEYAKNAESRGIKVIIAGAGGAAHLPGMSGQQKIGLHIPQETDYLLP